MLFGNSNKSREKKRDSALKQLAQAIDKQDARETIGALNAISTAYPEWGGNFDPNDPVVTEALEKELRRFAGFDYPNALGMLFHLAVNNGPSKERTAALTEAGLSLMEEQKSLCHTFAQAHLMTIRGVEHSGELSQEKQSRLLQQWTRVVDYYIGDNLLYDAVIAMNGAATSGIALLRQSALQKWQDTVSSLAKENPDRARELATVTIRDYGTRSEALKNQAALILHRP